MREIGKIAEGLFEKVRDRFEDVSLGDDKAMATQDPNKARFFNFDYTVDGHSYGNVTLSLIDEISLKVYFSKNITKDLSDHEKKHWYDFLRELREYARRNLLSFEPRDITRSTLKYRDIKQASKADDTYDKDEVVKESRMYGTSRSSYEERGPVKIIIRHNQQVDPERVGDRARKIRAIYLETEEGERFKLAYPSLRYARAMSRHLKEGGQLTDEFGQHITEMAAECAKLKSFKTAMMRRVFEDEETQRMVEAAFEYHGLLKNTLTRLNGRKGYTQCKEQFVHTSTSYIPEENFDEDSLRERFVKRTYNDRIQDALPLVHKAYNMMKENKLGEQFEAWANQIAEGTWAIPQNDSDITELIELLSKPLPVGVDADNAIGALYNLIGNDELYDLLGDLANENPEADVNELVMGWIEDNMPDVAAKITAAINQTQPMEESDKPVSMSRSELLDFLKIDPTKAHMYSNEKLRRLADTKSGEMTENSYGSYGAIEEDSDPAGRAIRRRIDYRYPDLESEYGEEAVRDAIDDVVSGIRIDPDDGIGSSDVSGWVRQVLDILRRSKPEEGGINVGDLEEGYDSASPNDSASPLTHADRDCCDACYKPKKDCECDDRIEENFRSEWESYIKESQKLNERMVDVDGFRFEMDYVIEELRAWFEHLNTGEWLDDTTAQHIEHALTTGRDHGRQLWAEMQQLPRQQFSRVIGQIVNFASQAASEDFDEWEREQPQRPRITHRDDDEEGGIRVGELREELMSREAKIQKMYQLLDQAIAMVQGNEPHRATDYLYDVDGLQQQVFNEEFPEECYELFHEIDDVTTELDNADENFDMERAVNKIEDISDTIERLAGFLSSEPDEEGGISVGDLREGQMKKQMHSDAERMSLEAFCNKYGDESWVKEFWNNINELDEGAEDDFDFKGTWKKTNLLNKLKHHLAIDNTYDRAAADFYDQRRKERLKKYADMDKQREMTALQKNAGIAKSGEQDELDGNAYEMGYRAAALYSKGKNSNPFEYNDPRHDEWLDGWREGSTYEDGFFEGSEDDEVAAARAAQAKIDKPAVFRKQEKFLPGKGDDWKVSHQDLEKAGSLHSKEFAARKKASGLDEALADMRRLAGLK